MAKTPPSSHETHNRIHTQAAKDEAQDEMLAMVLKRMERNIAKMPSQADLDHMEARLKSSIHHNQLATSDEINR